MSAHLPEFIPGPIQQIDRGHDHFFIKRLDLIKSWADGNKYYKLKNQLALARSENIKRIVSKGGMFSNHLYSLAHACAHFQIELVCVIRSYGDDLANPTLTKLKSLSKEIIYLTPENYNQFGENESGLRYPDAMFIDEGGMSQNAINGIKDLMEECLLCDPSHIIISGGSMTTASGLLAYAPKELKIIIVPAWKGCTKQYIDTILNRFNIKAICEWEIWPDAHRGGFAKYDLSLINFMSGFSTSTGIPLDPVYTGKMMHAIEEKMQGRYFKQDDRILAIHTGGLQGIKGVAYRAPAEWGEYAKLIFGNGD